MQLPASQQTPPAQLAPPSQATLHELPEQCTGPLHALPPVQPMVVCVARLETSAAHARGPSQLTAHVLPLHEMGCVQQSGAVH